jgi:hypothetical protein
MFNPTPCHVECEKYSQYPSFSIDFLARESITDAFIHTLAHSVALIEAFLTD